MGEGCPTDIQRKAPGSSWIKAWRGDGLQAKEENIASRLNSKSGKKIWGKGHKDYYLKPEKRGRIATRSSKGGTRGHGRTTCFEYHPQI